MEKLPRLIDRLSYAWDCEIVGQAWHGEVAIVVPVRWRSGGEATSGVGGNATSDAVLKVSFPHASFDGEVTALRHFDGRGTVRLLAAAESDCAVLLERAGPRTLGSVRPHERAVEFAGALARRLAVPAYDQAPSLAAGVPGWLEELERQRATVPDALPVAVVDRACETVEALGEDSTTTMMHGDLHAGNVLAADREPWLTIDPVGWRGTAAFDAFTAVAGARTDQRARTRPDVIRGLVRRFSAVAGVDPDLAEACCQARATSSYLHQRITGGDWFDPEFLRATIRLGF